MPRDSSLARLLQILCVGQVALAAGWLAWRWSASPAQAIGGAAAIMLVASAALAVEFVIVSRISRTDSAPRPSAAQLARAWVSETLHLFRTFYWRQPFCWRAEPDHLAASCAGRTGVVLVHGFMCNRGFWNAWMRDLRDRGHAFVAVNLEPVYGSIDGYVDRIEEAVAAIERVTGRAPLLVCHSMGGLAARAWWRRHGTQARIAHLLTIGTPHGGTWLARLSRRTNGRQMQQRSEWLLQLARDEQRQPLPATTCWFSSCDNVVFPASTATLAHADNRFVPGEPHVALAFHPDVRRRCLELASA